MRTVEVSRVVDASPVMVEAALDPAAIVDWEGSFEVFDLEEREDGWRVVAGGTGLRLVLRFEEREDGLFYEQEEADGQPLETMETTLTYRPTEGGETELTAVSAVSMGVRPAAITDRIAAWKRKSELERALSALADDVE